MLVIMRLYRSRLIGFLATLTRHVEMAEEISQETFLDLYRKRTQIAGAQKVRPWLFSAGKLLAMKELARRRHRVEQAVDDDSLALLAPLYQADQGHGLARQKLAVTLMRALDTLEPRDRELVSLRFFGELPIKDLAETLNMPMGSVGVSLSRALGKMRSELERQGLSLEELLL